ncbi:MAG: glycosyltransferase family 2 protein [Tannerellaceae bacterium]|nr:glycosyltransferase family 2 protein [Tannerellaceae bacterium]
MENRLLTIAIAVYNLEEYLPICINSLLVPSILDFLEILIIDDGSKDTSLQIACNYQKKYPGTVRVISKSNGGYGSAINVAIEHASAKYFRTLDADDSFDSEVFVQYIEKMKETDCDLVITNYSFNNPISGKLFDCLFRGVEYNKVYDFENFIIHRDLGNKVIAMHGITYKTEILQKNKFRLSYCYYSDLEYIIYPLQYVKTIVFYDLVVYKYLIDRNGQSVSDEGLATHYKEHEYIVKKLLNYCISELNDCKIAYRVNTKYKAMRLLNTHFSILYRILYKKDKTKAEKEIQDFKDYILTTLDQQFIEVAKKCWIFYEKEIDS